MLSRDEIDRETPAPQWDSKGTVVLNKATSKGGHAGKSRAMLTVMQSALLMIGLHHPSRIELKGTTQQLFEKSEITATG